MSEESKKSPLFTLEQTADGRWRGTCDALPGVVCERDASDEAGNAIVDMWLSKCTHDWKEAGPAPQYASARVCRLCQTLEIVAKGYIESISTTVRVQ